MKLLLTLFSSIALLGHAYAGDQGNEKAGRAKKPGANVMRTTYAPSVPKQMKEWTPNSKYGGHAFGLGTFEKYT